ncbi:flagellar biosynthesis repressor FlbT [Salipiger mangrovisoli]|uniref:Flagellar biosynthesis repressor FlbT n=1 Tax=Salipiger mangrovisoli TaxID=2865933 RepID=A0ABR9X0Q9_9RHOB|nr:flagellar biosynthesis repressor FlbT [Salipiger mangrovisoli]MBE9637144.1 flagellar biosynthesis repressor FlbT [Salipiger mangrovisoli]
MALNLTLKPFERIVVNGCMMRNGGRKTTLTVENRADIIRETDLLKPEAATTPVRAAYFLIQSALVYPERRDSLTKSAQQQLAKLATVFTAEMTSHVFEAANNVSQGEYFTALRDLRPLIKREAEVLGPAGLDPTSPEDLPRAHR